VRSREKLKYFFKEIETDEKVWSYDIENKVWVLKEVETPLSHHFSGDIVTIDVAGETIEATWNHPFWVTAGEALSERPEALHVPASERSQTHNGRWIDARHLREGDTVLLRGGAPAQIENLQTRAATLVVYNLRVADLSNYTVSNAGVLVHNKSWKYKPEFSKEMLSTSQTIAKGNKIREVKGLVREYGGRARDWVKKKGWDEYGNEWHWYENKSVGRVKVKLK